MGSVKRSGVNHKLKLERLSNHKLQITKRQAIICLSRIDAWIALFTICYDLSVSRNPLLKPKNHEICEIRTFEFLNCGSSYDLTDVSSFNLWYKNERPTYPRHSTMFQSCAISSQRPKCANLARAELTHMRLSGTDRLIPIQEQKTVIGKFSEDKIIQWELRKFAPRIIRRCRLSG